MLNLGSGELILIAVVALLVLGPKRLPELARGIGKALREFRRQTDDVRQVVEREFYKMDQAMDAEPPKLEAAPGAVPQGLAEGAVADPSVPVDPNAPPVDPDAAIAGDPNAPKAELAAVGGGVTAAEPEGPPLDESDPRHPDYWRSEPGTDTSESSEPAPEQATTPTTPAAAPEPASEPPPKVSKVS